MIFKRFYPFRVLYFVLIVLCLPRVNAASGYPVLLGDSSADKKPLSWLIQQIDNLPEQKRMDDSVVKDQLQVFGHIQQMFIPFSCMNKLIEEYVSRFQAQFNIVADVNISYCQKQNIPSGSEIVFVGDIHGSVHSLLKIIKNHIDDNFKIIKDNLYIVFTGDYVDRGMYGVEVWYALLRLKLANWDRVFVLRGNHENLNQNSDTPIGFFAELIAKYGVDNAANYLKKFDELYKRLVLVLYLKSGDSWIQCCHGAIDPCCDMRYFLNNSEMLGSIDFNKIGYGRTDVVNGFMWGDFQGNGSIIEMNLKRIIWLEYLSTCDMVKWFKDSGIQAIFRGHQHDAGGLSMFKDQLQQGPPIQWDGVVSMEEWGMGMIKVAHQKIPIFTFTAATEYGIAERAVYGILKTALRFEDWILSPVII
ncbi:MAG: metallophosphoesterase family protein [bacterium]